ncbi:glycosyltransferase [Polaribacter tangerinus]|uniref:glycosyltransferase n=1 Tax=Polaribacter tangerinus TaxID=1920034 RepID=UPI000B4C1FBC|nr:glycosyltransferase [Polaribacter tangerinus]
MRKIIVSVTTDLTTDQRVEKVCNTLYKNGFNVTLVGRKLANSSPLKRDYKVKRFQLFFNKTILFFAEYNIRLFFYLMFSKKELLLANDIDTLIPNYLIHKLQRKKLIFDSHELFSEIPELVHRKKVKKFWLSIENWILPNLKNNYTVSNSIANYYFNKYKVSFTTIANYPQKKKYEKTLVSSLRKDEKIIIYQGAVNIGRGLELMIETMSLLNNYRLIIIGEGDVLKSLKKLVALKNLKNKVVFMNKVSPIELSKITPNAHVGISLEEDLGLSYKYALPNKIFDYIQAKVPILVSDLPEMRKIVEEYGVGEILTSREPEILANKIETITTSDYQKKLKLAKQELVWEVQEKKLVAIFKNAQ